MIDLEKISSAKELTSEAVTQAAGAPTELKRLVARIAAIAGPEQGWARFFKVMAKVARAEWMEGDLLVELTGDDKGSTIECYAVLGAGIRERLFAPHYLAVPIDEFQRAVVLAPDTIAPLRAEQGLNRLTLASGAGWSKEAMPDFEVEEKAKGDGERITAPPPGDEYTRDTVPPSS